jgi:O-antigen ligase
MKFLIVLALVVLVGVAVGVVKLFIRWEREGREHLVPLGLLGMLVIEATIYADQNNLPRGIFHPGSGSTQLRLPEIYITLALLARLIVRGKPTRIGLPAGLWLAFAAWMVVGAVEGHLYHNALSQDLYEAKDILYIVGAYALAAGVPVRRYLESGDLFKLGYLAVGCASIVDLMTIARVSFNTNLPLLPLQDFGAVGSETAALTLAIGTMCFVPRLLTGPVRLRHVLALVPLLVSVVLADQRAVLVNLAALVSVVLVVLLIGHRHSVVRQLHIRAGQLLLGLLAIVALAMAVLVVPAAVDRQPVHVPLVSTFQSLFHSEGKAESAQDRLNLAAEAETLIPQHPIIGWGLGVEFPYYETGSRAVVTTAYAHDIALDLLLRLGAIGLMLFVFAFGASIAGGLQVWRRHPDPMTAGLALAIVAVLAGLIATGFLEPFLDEYRLATLFGVSLGMLRACVTSMDRRPGPTARRPGVPASESEVGDMAWT